MTTSTAVRVDSPTYQAYQILHVAFVVAPLVAGLDKFTHFLTNWDAYLAPIIPRTLGISGDTFMLAVRFVEVCPRCIVAFAPRIGAWIVGRWVCGITAEPADPRQLFRHRASRFWPGVGRILTRSPEHRIQRVVVRPSLF